MLRDPGAMGRLVRDLKVQYSERLAALGPHEQLQGIIVDVRGQGWTPAEVEGIRAQVYSQVVLSCYAEAKAADRWWMSERTSAPGPETVTALVGDVG
jgi:hypothetical protein